MNLKGFRRDSKASADGAAAGDRRDSALPPPGPAGKRTSVAVNQPGTSKFTLLVEWGIDVGANHNIHNVSFS